MYALESSRFGLKQARSGYYPTLSFGASYGTSYYHAYKGGDENNWTFAEQMRNNGSETLGFTLSVPLFNRLVTRNQVKQARLQIPLQELALDNARQQLYKEIEQAYYAAVAAHKKYISSQKSGTWPVSHSSMSRKSMMPENQRFLNIAMQKINMRKVCPNKFKRVMIFYSVQKF